MMLEVAVTVVRDNVVSENSAKVRLHENTLKAFIAGEYPMTLQIFTEAAIPRLVRDTIKEALEVPTRDNRN